ncbi:MAG: hypothetical protein WBF42_17150, partial [Terracidiphilus sp.]
VGDVFPTVAGCRWRWEAAWCSYIAFSGVYNEMLGILRNEYEKAADELATKHLYTKSRIDSDQGLAQHLAVFYWRQLITLDDPLLQLFLAKGDGKTIRSFLHELGHGIREVKDSPSEVVQSLHVLADWMLSAWKPSRDDAIKGLSAFGWWCSADVLGDPSWRLRLLGTAARKAGSLEDINSVLEELERVAADEPSLVIECLEYLIEGKPENHARYFLASQSLGILEKASSAADTRTKAKISEIANYFGSIGHFEYRPLA